MEGDVSKLLAGGRWIIVGGPPRPGDPDPCAFLSLYLVRPGAPDREWKYGSDYLGVSLTAAEARTLSRELAEWAAADDRARAALPAPRAPEASPEVKLTLRPLSEVPALYGGTYRRPG